MKHRHTIFHAGGVGAVQFLQKSAGAHYAELAFLHPVVFVGHIVHLTRLRRETSLHYFSYSGGTVYRKSVLGHIMPNFSFCIRWDLLVT
jgi:hypothetical protein